MAGIRMGRFAVLALGLAGLRSAGADCDPGAGAQVFQTKCAVCHSREDGKQLTGPSLYHVNGRRAGTLAGFNFSSALSDSGIDWGAASLEAFIASPQTYVPGTVMPFGGLKNSTERLALVCFLTSD